MGRTVAEQTERVRFVDRIQDESKNPDAWRLAYLLMRHAATHHRLQEMGCNGPPEWMHDHPKRVARWEREVERKEEQIERRIREIAEELGFPGVVFQGDPRGATVKLTLPSGYSDSWGGDGFCVPSR